MRSSSLRPVALAAFVLAGCGAPDSPVGQTDFDDAPAVRSSDALGGCDSFHVGLAAPPAAQPFLARAFDWVNRGVMYCQCVTGAGGPYRTDCSAFVSYIWGQPAPGWVTSQFATGWRDRGFSHAISWNEVAPGDALNYGDGHIMLFAGWMNDAHTRVCVIEESNYGKPAHFATHNFSDPASWWNAPGGRFVDIFRPIRLNGYNPRPECQPRCDGIFTPARTPTWDNASMARAMFMGVQLAFQLEETLREVRSRLNAVAESVDHRGVSVRADVKFGSIAGEILAAAKDYGSDLIVMESHRPEMKDYLIGPNAAHVALARLEAELARRGGAFTLVTQNIDDLHERAGSKNVIHMHGELLKARCASCGAVRDCRDDLSVDSRCGCGGALLPEATEWLHERVLSPFLEDLTDARFIQRRGIFCFSEPSIQTSIGQIWAEPSQFDQNRHAIGILKGFENSTNGTPSPTGRFLKLDLSLLEGDRKKLPMVF